MRNSFFAAIKFYKVINSGIVAVFFVGNEMSIRLYRKEDYAILRQMLLVEGIPEKGQLFAQNETYILDNPFIGFFTLGFQKGHPTLVHFCSTRAGNAAARLLVKAFCQIIQAKGFTQAILHATCGKNIDKFIEYYFKKKPYATVNNVKYYLVEV